MVYIPALISDAAALVLRWLPKLAPPSTVLKKDKKQWRPSQLESQDAFMLHVKVESIYNTFFFLSSTEGIPFF